MIRTLTTSRRPAKQPGNRLQAALRTVSQWAARLLSGKRRVKCSGRPCAMLLTDLKIMEVGQQEGRWRRRNSMMTEWSANTASASSTTRLRRGTYHIANRNLKQRT